MPVSFAESLTRELQTHICHDLGFVKKYGVLWRTIGDGVRGFLGLGRATYNSSHLVDIFPTVGVRFEAAYQLAVSLGAEPDTKTGCSVASPLRYLLPTSPDSDYCFRRGEDNVATAARLIADIKNYALPFYAKYSSVEAALMAIAVDGSHVRDRHTFVPVAHCHLGDIAKAVSVAEEYGQAHDPRRFAGMKYHEFIANLRLRLVEHGGERMSL